MDYACDRRIVWKVGRVTECAGLEIRYTLFGYRGFESLTFRKNLQKEAPKGFLFHFYKNKKSLPYRQALLFGNSFS